MLLPLHAASPPDFAALWRLDLLSGEDIAAICMRWLEEDLDQGDPDIAVFAGRTDLTLAEAEPQFERILKMLAGRVVEREEAILRVLQMHLAAALQDDHLMDGVGLALDRFADLSDHRLVRNPRRANDRPDGVYAAENLGLEYVYGSFHAFDDVTLPFSERPPVEAALKSQLRNDVLELHDHLASIIARPAGE